MTGCISSSVPGAIAESAGTAVCRDPGQAGGELGEPGPQLARHLFGIDVDEKRMPASAVRTPG